MSSSKVRRRRAPLPLEIIPDLEKKTSNEENETRHDTGATSNERLPRALPLGEPIVDRTNLLSESVPSTRYSWAPDCGIVKLTTKRRSLDDINFPSDNEALDAQTLTETVKTLDNTELHNGSKRHSSGDVTKVLHGSSSKTSLRSLNLSDRSFSLNSLSSYGADTVDSVMVDQEDIVTLTAYVRQFSEALSKLRNAFPGNGSDTDSDENTDGSNAVEEMHVKAHRSLGNVLSNLKQVINHYPSLRSNEILAAAGNLISKVRNLSYVDNKVPEDFYHAIDQLALVFSSSISDFLMGDQELSPNKVGDDGDDVDDFPEDGYDDDGSEGDVLSDSMNLSSRQESLNGILRDKDADIDSVLLKMESGVEFCLQWTKYWSKYVKDIANYIEKRAQLEAEYTKQLTKLAQATRASISEESYLPFQSTFITALDQDMEYSQKCQQTLVGISGSKFMEPLMQRRAVHDRARKDMKDEWTKTCKQLHDSANSVKTCRNVYHKRKQELEKLNTRQSDVKENKEDSFSVFSSNKDKKEADLRTKVEEAEQFYHNAIKIANDMQTEAEKTKVRIVAQTKQLVNECDRTFRSVTRKYFDMMHELAVPTPIHFKTLAESCQGYEPGKEFECFVRFQQSTARPALRTFYEFQHHSNLRSGHDLESPVKGSLSPMKSWTSGHLSDYDGGVSPSGSPSSSPKTTKKSSRARHHPPPSTDDESEGEMKKTHSKLSKSSKTGRRTKGSKFSKVPLTQEASTHTFHKIRAPAKCSECDSYVFSGVECAQCGLSFHTKKCLENLYTTCTHSRVPPSPMKPMKTFGVRFSEDGGVPVLVTKCVKEINRRGLKVKGIYRVSGVKSRMENLCQEFETNAESVDLSTQPPHLIASVLKLYIRQLPEPLMTTKLYADLIQIAKESIHLNNLSIDEYEGESKQEFKKLLEKLQLTLKKLPRSNYLTTATLIKHLNKVSMNEEYNQMNSQNLAIVFGPTILRLECENSATSLSSLVDMSHQTRIVALLIVNPQVFDDVPDEPEEEPGNVSNEESEKNDSSVPHTPVKKFVLQKSEEDDTGMPDLYSERSSRLRGEGLSPMDQLLSQSYDVQDDSRINLGTLKRNERIDVKGEATTVFDEASISLPGSLEERSRYVDFTQSDSRLTTSDHDTDRASHSVEQNQHPDDKAYNSLPNRNETQSTKVRKTNDCDFSKSSKEDSLADEVQDELNRKMTESHNDFSPGESEIEVNEELSYRRHRAKAFSVSKPNVDPEMLAKRGSALMNAYMGDNNINTEGSESSRDLPSKKQVHNSVVGTNYLDQEDDINVTSEVKFNGETVASTSTVTNATANETTVPDRDKAPVSPEPEPQNNLERASKDRSGTTSPILSTSGDESSVSSLYRDTPSRKRSATYDNDQRRKFETTQERLEKQLKNDRLLMYGVRSRRTGVSVKDQVKQLESREQQSDTFKAIPGPLGVRNNKFPGTGVTPFNKVESKGTVSDTLTTLDNVDGKENVNGKVKSHEPLTRLHMAGGNSGTHIFQPPRIPVPKYRTIDDRFCALKMDISLDSPRTPTSESSDEDSDNTNAAMGTRLPTWTGLTPRDSSQAPEFV